LQACFLQCGKKYAVLVEQQTYLKSKREAARYLGISPGSLERLMRNGLAYVRVGGLVRFRPEDLTAYIERGRVVAGGGMRPAA
jgi:excisionase family DNA binding protein